MNPNIKGLIYGSIAAATYGMNPLFALPLYSAGMNVDSVLFYRYSLAIPILAVMIKARGRDFWLKKNEILPLGIVGLLFALSSLLLFQSYNYMDAGIASTLLFVYPIMVAVIMAVFFKEKITLLTVACICMALSGIALLYKSDDGTSLSLTGVIMVLFSALTYAIYIVSVNKSVLKEIATVKLTFYALIFGTLLFFVRLDFGTSLQIVPKWYLWGNVIALAVLPTVVSLLCTTQAIHTIGATPTAILGALEPVTAVIFGVTVFGERLTGRLVIGIMLIIMAVMLIVAGGKLGTYLLRFRKLFPNLRKRGTADPAENKQPTA